MSLFARPSIVIAIVFGCFAVLIPRVFLPLFRSRPISPSHHTDDHFRRLPSSMPQTGLEDVIEKIPGSPLHRHGAHPNMRSRQSGADGRQQPTTGQSGSKSSATFALPMYTVGIGVFFLYTCFKYWTKRNTKEDEIKLRYSTNNIQWNAHKRKFKYNVINRQNEDDDEEQYTGLDPDYVEYLRLKKQKEIDVEQNMTLEQQQMQKTLDDMKNSLSFISSKLGTNRKKNKLSTNEISQLQERLTSTEAQMCKILNAIDVASTKVSELTKNNRQSLEEAQQTNINEEEHPHLSSPSLSENEDSDNDEENSDSEENSFHEDEQLHSGNHQNEQEEEDDGSSSSYEEDEEIPHNEDDEDDESESESLSERYGLMNTNYECDPTLVDDYELNTSKTPTQPSDSRTKVQEWRQRNHSQSLGSNSSNEQDQAIPNEK